MTPQPLDLSNLKSGETRLVCPQCKLGTLRLHIRYERAPTTKLDLVVIPQWLRCTRTRKCGYWRPVV